MTAKAKSVKRQRESELKTIEEKRTIDQYDKILSVRHKNSTSVNPLELVQIPQMLTSNPEESERKMKNI